MSASGVGAGCTITGGGAGVTLVVAVVTVAVVTVVLTTVVVDGGGGTGFLAGAAAATAANTPAQPTAASAAPRRTRDVPRAWRRRRPMRRTNAILPPRDPKKPPTPLYRPGRFFARSDVRTTRKGGPEGK